MNFPTFLEELINAGIEVTISRNDRLGVYFDLNLRAKSHMYLYLVDNDTGDGQWYVDMRYDKQFPVDGVDDLKRLARYGMHGRDFINAYWAEFLMSDEERAKLNLARNAMSKLSVEEQQAVMEYLK